MSARRLLVAGLAGLLLIGGTEAPVQGGVGFGGFGWGTAQGVMTEQFVKIKCAPGT